MDWQLMRYDVGLSRVGQSENLQLVISNSTVIVMEVQYDFSTAYLT